MEENKKDEEIIDYTHKLFMQKNYEEVNLIYRSTFNFLLLKIFFILMYLVWLVFWLNYFSN